MAQKHPQMSPPVTVLPLLSLTETFLHLNLTLNNYKQIHKKPQNLLWEEAQSLSNPTPVYEKSLRCSSSFHRVHKQQERAAITHGTKTSPAAESGKFSWLQSCRAGSTEAQGAGTPTAPSCPPALPPWLCQPHIWIFLSIAPPQRQQQVLQLCPHPDREC